ncbi:MAG: hypothetical protein ACRDJ4_08540 [Actinomycetota bacterium]
MIWLDAYERKARLLPGLLVVIPVMIVIAAVGLREQPMVAFIGGLLGATGSPVLLVNTVRDRGLKVQEILIEQWGGMPTTISLRHRGAASDDERRAHWRANVIRATGRGLSSSVEEASDPGATDARYTAAIADIREMTRDTSRFPLVFEENRNFGFERNLLGARPLGIWVAALCSLALLATVVLRLGDVIEGSRADALVALAFTIGMSAMWVWLPSADRVRRVGFRYAERLLDSAGQVTERGATT